jgi:pseudouridine kinase
MPLAAKIDPYVCVIGAASVDLSGRSHRAIVAQESNPGSLHVSWGGVGRNIAENLARLGLPVHLITALGDDDFSRRLIRHATECGIGIHAQIIAGGTTPAYLCINDVDGELLVAVAAMELLDQFSLDWVRENAGVIGNAGLCVIDANLDQELIGYLLEQFPEQEFFVDAVSIAKAEKLKPWLGRFGAIKLNRAEAGHLSGINISGLESMQEAAAFFLEKGIRQVFISLGSNGLFFSDSKNCGSLRSEPGMKAINTTGAGDAMTACLAAASLRGLGLEEAAYLSMAAASITLQHQQAVNPNINMDALKELKRKIHHA